MGKIYSHMQTHPYFPDILLHTDTQLADLLGTKVVQRDTIHEWPLSCVQRLLLADGTRLIYKSQLQPTVESQFYQAASSSLLPGHRPLGTLGQCDIIILDWIDAPLLRDVVKSEADLLKQGRQVIAQIGQMQGDLPTYLDISSPEAWASACDHTFEQLEKLITDKRFTLTSLDTVERVRRWTQSTPVLAKLVEHPCLIHGDLTSEQIFVVPGGYRVIDWQRPVIAPPEVDLVTLLVSQNVEPRRYLDASVIGIYWFLLFSWAVKAQAELFPQQHGPLFDQWAAQSIHNILSDIEG